MVDYKALRKSAENVESADELISLLEKEGIKISPEDAEKYYKALKRGGELGDDELDTVSGGGCYSSDGSLLTTIGYGCSHYEKDEEIGGVDGTCYTCRYWQKENSTGYIFVGASLKCTNPLNRRK